MNTCYSLFDNSNYFRVNVPEEDWLVHSWNVKKEKKDYSQWKKSKKMNTCYSIFDYVHQYFNATSFLREKHKNQLYSSFVHQILWCIRSTFIFN